MKDNVMILSAMLGCAVIVWRAIVPPVRAIKETMNWLEKFRRDWEGEPGGPGRDPVPGVMERLNRLDGELSNNGGSSMKDAIDRIEKRLGTNNEFTQN